MPVKPNRASKLYGWLLRLYPRAFRARLGVSMQQTFDDLYREQNPPAGRGFVVWLFLETAVGIAREHLTLVVLGGNMRRIQKSFVLPALLSLVLIVPFMLMELINRRAYQEDFPVVVFFLLWWNLFAALLIVLPILTSRAGAAQQISGPSGSRFDEPRTALLVGLGLALIPVLLLLLEWLGWLPLQALVNGPDPGQTYLPGLLFTYVLLVLPVAGGVIAARPIAQTLRAGGSLFAHPLHLALVALLVFSFSAGFLSWLIDQWPCFVGVPVCD